MNRKNIRVLGFGDNVVDMYEHVHIMYPGGNCVNFSAYAKMNGADSAYMGYFGNDAAAELIKRVLRELDVDIRECQTLEGENGYSKVTIIDGDRIFGDYNEGGIRGKTPWVLDDHQLDYLRTFDLIHSGNYSFMENELGKIRELGVPVSFDFSDDSPEEYYRKTAPNVTYAFCSRNGTDEEVKAHLRFVKELGPDIVCASRGALGCILYDGKRFYEQPAVPLTRVVDTMGAGDSLLTSFLIGYLDRIKKGIEHEMAVTEAISDAAEFAALVCGMDGAFGHGMKYED